jgi:hypothetical protein
MFPPAFYRPAITGRPLRVWFYDILFKPASGKASGQNSMKAYIEVRAKYNIRKSIVNIQIECKPLLRFLKIPGPHGGSDKIENKLPGCQSGNSVDMSYSRRRSIDSALMFYTHLAGKKQAAK